MGTVVEAIWQGKIAWKIRTVFGGYILDIQKCIAENA